MSDVAKEILRVEGLKVEYYRPEGNIRIVDEVSFHIRERETLGLAGESGSGKSTIVKGLLRLLRAPAMITGGRVFCNGQDLLQMNADEMRRIRWREISLVMQSAMNALNPVMTIGAQIVDVIRAHEKATKADALERSAELLKLVGIPSDRLSAYPHELSGGMRQRAVIAMALALSPSLVIMDEPTTALDVVLEREILHQIRELQEQLGFAVLFITHDLSLMLEFCNFIGVLYAGRLVETAPSKQLFENPQHPYTKGLMDSFPGLHHQGGRMRGIDGHPPDMRLPPPGCRFHPRCKDAMDICKIERPTRFDFGKGQKSTCHLNPK